MKRSLMALAVPAGLMVTAPATGAAQLVQQVCAPSSVHVCVTAQFTISGGNTLNVFLFNGSGGQGTNWQSVLTEFGVGDLPTAGAWALGSVYFNDWNGTSLLSNGATALAANGGWTFNTSIPSAGITLQAGANGPGGNGGISTCDGPTGGPPNLKRLTCEGGGTTFGGTDDWLKFSFTYSLGGLTQSTLDNLDWAYKVQAVEGLAGQSYECETLAGTHKYCAPDTPDNGVPLETVTPEPGTMSMLAFGLAGMAAAARRRRKR